MTKCALVCGAGGFIGGHLVNRLKNDGFWVRGVSIHLYHRLMYNSWLDEQISNVSYGDIRVLWLDILDDYI